MTLPRRARSAGLVVARKGFWFGGRMWGVTNPYTRAGYWVEIIGRVGEWPGETT